MCTTIAVVLVGVWMAITSQNPVSSTTTLIFAVLVIALAMCDLLPVVRRRVP